MGARGNLRAKRLHSALPDVWFADSEVAAKKKKKSQSTEAVEGGGTA